MVVGNNGGSGDDDDDVIMSQVPMGTFSWYPYPQARVRVLGGYGYGWTPSYPWVTRDGPYIAVEKVNEEINQTVATLQRGKHSRGIGVSERIWSAEHHMISPPCSYCLSICESIQ